VSPEASHVPTLDLGLSTNEARARQMANAFACRSTVLPVWRMKLFGNPLILGAAVAETALLLAFLGIPAISATLGGTWPPARGWLMAGCAGAVLIVVDGLSKHRRR